MANSISLCINAMFVLSIHLICQWVQITVRKEALVVVMTHACNLNTWQAEGGG
jgi:hypothetical protein